MADQLPTGASPRPAGEPDVRVDATATEPSAMTEPAPTSAPPAPTGRLDRAKAKLLRLEDALNRHTSSPSARRWLLIGALVLFVVISAVSFESLKGGVHFHLWAFLVLALVATPLTVAVNAAEYRAAAAVAGHQVGWPAALRLTVLSIAANLLPLPGGVAIRTQAMRQLGSTYKRALFANAAAGLAWVGVGCLAIGALLAATDERLVAGIVLLVIGLATLLALWRSLLRNDAREASRHLGRLVWVELLTVGVSAGSIALGFAMLGFHVSAAQAVALAGSVILSTAIGIFPAGLGIRELLAGAIGAVVDLRAVTAVAAVAAERVAILIGMAITSVVVLTGLRGDDTDGPLGEAVDPGRDEPDDIPASE
ncbi:MAG TPA: hypothetical protein VHA73_14545 [Acidimicrobiales bacterium]|nr:hypothetical protein [Acidimicrobiales bacterium]